MKIALKTNFSSFFTLLFIFLVLWTIFRAFKTAFGLENPNLKLSSPSFCHSRLKKQFFLGLKMPLQALSLLN